MNASNIGQNIKRLREAKKITQDELAQALSISFQAVSKWENDVTVPDTLMLPQIASYFGVTVDELFRPECSAYANDAQRLLAVYEASGDRNDFIRADAEFKKLFESGEYTRDDVRCYGVLNEFQMYECRYRALEQYDKILAGPERDAIYRSARQQRLLLLSRIGRGDNALAEERQRCEAEPDDVSNWTALTVILYFTERYEETLSTAEQALTRFAADECAPLFHLYAGDACRQLKRYEEAFAHWNRTIEMGFNGADPLFSIAFCLHEQGKYAEEIEAWKRVIDWLTKRGFVHELAMPREEIRKARELLTAG